MFGAKKREEIAALQNELASLRVDLSKERERADHFAKESSRLQTSTTEATHYAKLFTGLSHPLGQFTESVKALQSSLAAMSQAMKKEVDEAVQASSETLQTKEQVEKLTGRIAELM